MLTSMASGLVSARQVGVKCSRLLPIRRFLCCNCNSNTNIIKQRSIIFRRFSSSSLKHAVNSSFCFHLHLTQSLEQRLLEYPIIAHIASSTTVIQYFLHENVVQQLPNHSYITYCYDVLKLSWLSVYFRGHMIGSKINFHIYQFGTGYTHARGQQALV